MNRFKRVLIANRGEIAIRIAKAASALGIESVGVHAAVDAWSLHTRVVTEARELGSDGGDPVGAYLDAGALIEIARETGCDCVHPGYGFLAENAPFADRCTADGLAFVGPGAGALALFGDKVRARELAASLDIPVVPGGGVAVTTWKEAAEAAGKVGYPVMLKAAAGGGGRGMRAVTAPDGMRAAFDRCQGEAAAAFGDPSLFVEKLIQDPRHIEVQVLADSRGNVVHLFERDCSVQLRNQKLIETAPAPDLDDAVRARLHADAVKLAGAANYVNAGTVEFLVTPETGEHYFIECNPRIQVEHTVTEQVTGIDLVEAQFRIAAGATLDSLGMGDQSAIAIRRGYSVQARVNAAGAGTISAYKEPSGPGVRVDASGYLGYAPPPQFDPLLAKVICTSTAGASFSAAVERTRRTLDEFHIAGLVTNLPMLRAILEHPDMSRGDARTTLLAQHPELLTSGKEEVHNGTLALLEQRAAGSSPGPAAGARPAEIPPLHPELPVPDGDLPVVCAMSGAVLEVHAAEGEAVTAGETLLVISAMKMESEVTAPCPGTLSAVQALEPGDSVAAGQVVMAISPAEGSRGIETATSDENTWAPLMKEVAAIKRLAQERLKPGSQDPGVVRQRSRGKLTCRERIDLLLDEGSFREVGSVTGFPSYDEDGNIDAFTPSNHVGGWGRVEGRPAVVCADDFTSRGGHSDGAIGAKSTYLDRLSLEMRMPSIRLLDGSSGGGSVASMVPQQKRAGESKAKESEGAIKAGRPRVAGTGGSFLPGHQGGTMFTEQLATVPGGEHAARQRSGPRRRQGRARPLLGHGARHRPAVRRRAAGGQPRHGLRDHQGRSRRLAHPLHERLRRQPGRHRRGSGADRAALSFLPAVEHLRAAAGRAAGP